MRRTGTALPLALLLLGSGLCACRCGGPGAPRAYDVGVPVGDLPRAQVAQLSALPTGPLVLYAEAGDGRELARALTTSAPYQALEKSGALAGLSHSGTAATLTALAQRLNDLSRSPIGDEALADVLEGPLAVAVRTGPRGLDVMLVKALTPQAQGALRLAQMLEAVHPSATEVRVERHQGLPIRALRLDGSRRLHYVVLRDRLLLATDPAWLRSALDVALGLAPASTPQSVRALQAASQGARGFAVLDGEAAQKSQELGAASRALAGLAWVGLRWRGGETVEVGIRRSQGSFGASATPLPLPPATALAIARDASLGELLALPPDLPRPDGGLIEPAEREGRQLLRDVELGLGPALEGHALYAMARAESDRAGPEHLLALSTRAPGAAAAALEALSPRLFRAAPARRDDLAPGARCVGAPPAVCWADVGPLLALSTAPSMLRAELESPRNPHTLPAGAFAMFVDPAELVAELGTAGAGQKRRLSSPELDALVAGLRSGHAILVDVPATAGAQEAWGQVSLVAEPRREPAPPLRDGGAP